jgi:hypothetical protein
MTIKQEIEEIIENYKRHYNRYLYQNQINSLIGVLNLLEKKCCNNCAFSITYNKRINVSWDELSYCSNFKEKDILQK